MKSKLFCSLLLLLGLSAVSFAADDPLAWKWYEVSESRQVTVHLYVFFRSDCSHCQEALKHINTLEPKYPWLDVHKYEVGHHSGNLELYRRMAKDVKRTAGTVPAFFYCKKMSIGYYGEATTGKQLEKGLTTCHEKLQAQLDATTDKTSGSPPRWQFILANFQPEPEEATKEEAIPELDLDMALEDEAAEETVDLPLAGEVDVNELSLPLFTLILAGCDAFNPCAFFILLSLLSLLIHARSRTRMLLVGGIFVLFSGLFYFLFMAAWLNVFFLAGHLTWITTGAGIAAILVAAINIKDYFAGRQGISLSIPDSAKPGLFQRMRGLLDATRIWPMLLGTIALAAAANTYELLCTAGFPMVFTRVLTLRELSLPSYYTYLVIYNLIYVVPLAVIVIVFTYTLGSRKLQEHEGRVLKLLSGVMMLYLGAIIIVAPSLLHSIFTAVGLLVASIVTTAVVAWVTNLLQPAANNVAQRKTATH
ncbi:hypothetical protein LOC68_01480 [Blastopirellula sp. JC732]|uniref:Thioredoxin domain-containing protein n=1 Tax=Blastopirellula sediminis TaxID=2894196 RepID=A0A9X1MHV8_9BACT|nr:hypothetical protein [Blastopirellula sediminis]MCC9608141.1 hypothetical protein [Blastopirellula sediminis]MCC9627066.1 hypothetical protein [Blastopirellula sediminis]